MSYEGRIVYLCENGHRYMQDCYDANKKCPFCKAKSIWSHSIDDTNDEAHGTISEEDWDNFILHREKSEVCECCGHETIIAPAVYRVPSPDEVREIECWWDHNTLRWRKCTDTDEE